MLWQNVVRVELVDPWWQQLLPVAALLVSLFSVGLTLWFRREEGARLDVSLVSAILMVEESIDTVGIRIANVSRATTSVVTSARLEVPAGWSFSYVTPPVPGMEGELPHKLAPGEELVLHLPMEGLAHTLAQRPQEVRWVRAVVSTAHGHFKSARSRPHAAAIQREASALLRRF